MTHADCVDAQQARTGEGPACLADTKRRVDTPSEHCIVSGGFMGIPTRAHCVKNGSKWILCRIALPLTLGTTAPKWKCF